MKQRNAAASKQGPSSQPAAGDAVPFSQPTQVSQVSWSESQDPQAVSFSQQQHYTSCSLHQQVCLITQEQDCCVTIHKSRCMLQLGFWTNRHALRAEQATCAGETDSAIYVSVCTVCTWGLRLACSIHHTGQQARAAAATARQPQRYRAAVRLAGDGGPASVLRLQ